MPNANCLLLFMQEVNCACSLARDNAGNSIAARMAMMAMTTNNSISVNPAGRFPVRFVAKAYPGFITAGLNLQTLRYFALIPDFCKPFDELAARMIQKMPRKARKQFCSVQPQSAL
jgi:hypothetical protein